MAKDIFDIISPNDPDVFDLLETKKQEKSEMDDLADSELSNDLTSELKSIQKKIEEKDKSRRELFSKMMSELKNFVRSEIKKIEVTQNVVERIVEKQPIIKNVNVPIPGPTGPMGPRGPQGMPGQDSVSKEILKEVTIKEPVYEVKEVREIKTVTDNSEVDILKETIQTLKKELEETRRIAESPIVAPGGPGVIGIPPPEPNPDGHVLTVTKGKAVWAQAASSTAGANPFYIGDENTDGSWRLRDDGTNLIVERRESGTWTEKAAFES